MRNSLELKPDAANHAGDTVVAAQQAIAALIAELCEVMLSVMIPSSLPPPPINPCAPSIKKADANDSSPRVTVESAPIASTLGSSNLQASHAITLSKRMTEMALRKTDSLMTNAAIPDAIASDGSTIHAPLLPLYRPTSSLPQVAAPSSKPEMASAKSSSLRLPRMPVIHPPISTQTAHQHSQVRAALDAPLVLQQLTHGVFDPASLFEFLGRLIKFHCAPMRDAKVDEMVAIAKSSALLSRVRDGTHEAAPRVNLDLAVLAIRKCFDLFELMKLVSP
jgi:hypothetical protein